MMSAIAGDDQHVWTHVSLTFNRPWFFITCVQHAIDGDIRQNFLLSSPQQIISIMEIDSNESDVEQLMLVSPKELNRSEYWRMEPLVAIWRAKAGAESTLM
jgi:hypothetical protein